jgi:hypothetical protein
MSKEKYLTDPAQKQKQKDATKKWINSNPEWVCSYRKSYQKLPWTKIPQNLQKRLAEKTKFRSRIGMRTPELKIYLESLFLDGMNWENYGKVWQIRLIRPINDFDLNDSGEVSKINHYTNLKPSFSPEFLKSQELLKK